MLLPGVVLEVRVVAGLLGGDAAGRVVDQHHLEQVQTLFVKILAQRQVVLTNPLGEGGLEVRIAGYARPDVFSGCAKESEQPC